MSLERTALLERTAIPREFSNPRRFTRRFRLLVALAALAAISGPIACVAALADDPPEVAAVAEPRHEDYATVVAQSYLDGQPLPLPVARGLTPAAGRDRVDEGATLEEAPQPVAIPHTWVVSMGADITSIPIGERSRRTVETHRFLVGTAGGPFVLAVPVIETSRRAPALGAIPAIEPFVPDHAASELEPLDWSAAYETTRASPTLRERVREWAEAFAADDRRGLLEITGDSRNGIEYVGLGAWRTDGEPDIGGLFTRGDGSSVTHVEIPLVASGDPAVTTRVSFDLLVQNADEPLPAIVAWGPSGTALTLEAYENAARLPEAEPSSNASTTTSTGWTAATAEGGA